MCKDNNNLETDFERTLDYIADKLLLRNRRQSFFFLK